MAELNSLQSKNSKLESELSLYKDYVKERDLKASQLAKQLNETK